VGRQQDAAPGSDLDGPTVYDILYNDNGKGNPFQATSPEVRMQFYQILRNHGVTREICDEMLDTTASLDWQEIQDNLRAGEGSDDE
jgi:hypothetical protein